MSPGRSPKRGTGASRYDPWAQATPDPEPEARTPSQARTRAEWDALVPRGHNATIPSLPWRLDWQRNPKAPLPPGYALVRCLDGWTLVREPDARPKPKLTIGSRCPDCKAPLLRIKDRRDPYRPPEGFLLARCLCRLELYRVIYGWQLPDGPCERCGAPQQQVADSDAGYSMDILDGRERPGAREFWRALDRQAWAFEDIGTPTE